MIVDPLSSSLPGVERLPTAVPARPAGPPRGAEAAPGSEPAALWDLLTVEEQAFFSAQSARGPLTYRPVRGATPTPAGPTGQRIDRRG